MSSLRQKMVVVQPNEFEQKKKRQTLERAKANHLSKQLQMRLQYAKLKVEHGWQRQNLNEVENLYFHHSHQRSIRQGAASQQAQWHHYTTATYPVPSADTHVVVQSPAPFELPDRTVGPSPSTNDVPLSSSVSPPSQSPSEHALNPDAGQSLSQLPLYLPAQTLGPVAPTLSTTDRPSSALDLFDPNLFVRLAQLQAQVQLASQPQSHVQSQSQTFVSASTSASQVTPALVSIPTPSAFSPQVQLSQPPTSCPQSGFTLSGFAPQPFLGTPTPSAIPLYPIPASTPHNPTATSQPPVPFFASIPTVTSTPGPVPTAPIPTPTPIAPSALTYDSFWSTHASSTGPTRALYRTHTGFTASATPGGNVAMLTPGGHAAIMTAEGVYVGGGSK